MGGNADKITFADIVYKLRKNERFSFLRYGDGDWNCVMGLKGFNGDKHQYFPDLGERMKNILLSKPPYYIGIQSFYSKVYRAEQKKYNIEWCDADILHRASIAGWMNEFFAALEGKKVTIVGGEHLAKLPMQITKLITVSPIDCWLEYDRVKKELSENLNEVILLACGMLGKVLLDDFYKEATIIDAGSVLDPYAGKATRGYHKDILARLA